MTQTTDTCLNTCKVPIVNNGSMAINVAGQILEIKSWMTTREVKMPYKWQKSIFSTLNEKLWKLTE